MEIDITETIILGVMVTSAFFLGFIVGKAYLRRKMKRREEEEKPADYLPTMDDIIQEEEDDETRNGRDGFGIGEGHEEPPE